MRIYPEERIRRRVVLVAACCMALSLPGMDRGGDALWTLPFVWAGGAVYVLAYLRRWRRRLVLARRGLSEEDRRVLRSRVSFYGRLGGEDRERFEELVAVFLGEHRMSGVDDVRVTREVRLLVAASAVRLVFGRPEWEYPDFGEILIYPGPFRTDGSYSTEIEDHTTAASGLVHSIGGVIISLPDLYRGFEDETDGYNVGYHEFAHVLDGRRPDGVPDNLELGAYRGWAQVMHSEFERVRRGDSLLRGYAGSTPAEFFACSVEAFFEEPHRMREAAPELYEQLAGYFNQKPGDSPDGVRQPGDTANGD